MATASELATRALKRLGVVPAGGTASAEDIADTVQALEDMFASWYAKGLTFTVPTAQRFDAGIIAMLAVRMADDFGKQPTPILMGDADEGWNDISAAFFAVPASRFDSALKYTGHYSDVGFIIGDQTESYDIWRPSTAYELRRYVRNGANLYECVVAGTSATTGGPTGTDDSITDGTVTWCWRRIAGEPDEGSE